MKNKGLKRITLALLLVVFLMTAGLTFAYWYNGQNTKTDSQTIAVGEASTTLEVVIDNKVLEGTKLVPTGMAQYSVGGEEFNVDKIVLTYNLTANRNDLDAKFLYNVSVTAQNTRLLNVKPVVDGSLVTVTITLTEPKNEAEYNALQALGLLTFELAFTVTVTPKTS